MTALRRALYASASLGIGSLDYIVAVFLLKYYTNYTGLDAMWAGVALLIGKAFDGVSDPIMGYVSDRTRSPWGRRRPWFLLGSLPLAISMIGMFSARPEWSETQLFAWLLVTNILYWVGCTMVEVPHAAYGSEMTSTHRERISVMGWRQGFATLGLLLGGILMFTVLEHAVDAATAGATAKGLRGEAVQEIARVARGRAHGQISAFLAVYVVAVTVITFLGTRERRGIHAPPRDTLFGDFGDTLRSHPFRLYVLAFIVGQVADGLTATLALYTIEEWWGLGDPHPKFILLGYMAMAVLSIPVWMRVAVHFEKGHMLAVGTFMGAIGLLAMLFVPRIGLWWAYASFYFAGVGLGVRTVMAMAIVPDIVDDDEVRTRTRKDGAYFGMLSLLRKLSRSLAIGLSGIGLGFFGYVSGAIQQDAEAQRGIIVMFCAVPLVFSIGAGVLFLLFPITRAEHEETRIELERRRGQREGERTSPA
jgi:GPH family glycoside/pentoside/hexuronide:cation symporter